MPSLAVIATWLISVGWLVILGSPAMVLAVRRFGWLAAIRIGMWFGLATAVFIVVVMNFFIPLRSSAAVITAAIATALIVATTVLIALLLRGRSIPVHNRSAFPWWSMIVIGALGLGLLAVAHASFGAANQWDAGLYHLNAIQYASEYRVIPGLANLHDRFGVTNSQHLLTALLSNSGWGLDAFRLQVGFFVFLFAIDVSLRLLGTGRTKPTAGTVVALLTVIGLWPFLLSNPYELITSPTPDTVALLVTVIGGAYLVDALTSRRTEWASTGIVILSIAASIRTQLWAFAVIAAVVVLVVFYQRGTAKRRPRILTLMAGALSAGLLVATQIRDAIQSGWVLFPLDLLALPVDWKAFDPAASRVWIVSWARTPGASPDDVLGNWSWVGGWLARSAADWAFQLTVGLLALAATIWLFQRSRQRSGAAPIRALWLLIPTGLAVVMWFLSAPDPRFAWGQIALLGAIPAGVAVVALLRDKAKPVAAGFATLAVLPASVLAVTAIDGETQEGQTVLTFQHVPWTVSAALTPVPSPELAIYTLPTGQELITPTSDDRCWTAFPLCRPYPNDTLLLRGDSVQDGFASRLWLE